MIIDSKLMLTVDGTPTVLNAASRISGNVIDLRNGAPTSHNVTKQYTAQGAFVSEKLFWVTIVKTSSAVATTTTVVNLVGDSATNLTTAANVIASFTLPIAAATAYPVGKVLAALPLPQGIVKDSAGVDAVYLGWIATGTSMLMAVESFITSDPTYIKAYNQALQG